MAGRSRGGQTGLCTTSFRLRETGTLRCDISNGFFRTLPGFIRSSISDNVPGANHKPASKTHIPSRIIDRARSIVCAVKFVEGQTQTWLIEVVGGSNSFSLFSLLSSI